MRRSSCFAALERSQRACVAGERFERRSSWPRREPRKRSGVSTLEGPHHRDRVSGPPSETCGRAAQSLDGTCGSMSQEWRSPACGKSASRRVSGSRSAIVGTISSRSSAQHEPCRLTWTGKGSPGQGTKAKNDAHGPPTTAFCPKTRREAEPPVTSATMASEARTRLRTWHHLHRPPHHLWTAYESHPRVGSAGLDVRRPPPPLRAVVARAQRTEERQRWTKSCWC